MENQRRRLRGSYRPKAAVCDFPKSHIAACQSGHRHFLTAKSNVTRAWSKPNKLLTPIQWAAKPRRFVLAYLLESVPLMAESVALHTKEDLKDVRT